MRFCNFITILLLLFSLHIAVNEAKAKCCGDALVRDLPDASMSSSTVHDAYENFFGKLNDDNPEGWVPKGDDQHPYLEFDLGKLYLICGFEVKGCKIKKFGNTYDVWVTRYRVQVSPENDYWDSWNYIKPEFYGGKSSLDKAFSCAKERKVGRYVRIFPVAQETPSKVKFKSCLKAEIYGIPYLRENEEVFVLDDSRVMSYVKWRLVTLGAVEARLSSKLRGEKIEQIGETKYTQVIPIHTPLKTEIRVDSCVIAPKGEKGYFIAARVEKVNLDTDEYFVKNLIDVYNDGRRARKVKRDQLQVIFSAWCKVIGDLFQRVSDKRMCLGKIVQVDSTLVFKPAGKTRELVWLLRNPYVKGNFDSYRPVDQIKHGPGKISVVTYQDKYAKCDLLSATIDYKPGSPTYRINKKPYIVRVHELWYKEEEPDSCKKSEKANKKCWNSRIPYMVNRLNCSSLQVWNGLSQNCEDEDECATGMAACGLYAACKNTKNSYACYCPHGFTGENAHKEDCQDIDECQKRNKNKCHKDAICINTVGSYTCQCIKGFKGNGRFCEDINECKVFANLKHCEKNKNAICKNFPGGYQCECKPGYYGDVKQCKDVDECSSKKHKCSPYAHCTNTIGSYKCACKKGFLGDGRKCEDKKECEEPSKGRSCHAHGHCVDTLGSYECQCKEGYFGDGIKSCVIANECELGIHKCHKTWATCVNTRKSYDCLCNKGFEGDGRTCKDIDECALKKHECNLKIKGAECLNTNGSYKCICGKGFSGDGKQCVDIDECRTGTHDCVKNAICVNKDGGFSCRCREGYRGDAKKRCDPETECMRRLPHCDVPRAICKNGTDKSGSKTYECFCKSGYTGDNSNCIDIDECLNKDTCSKDGMCTNTVGGFSCRCKDGYKGNGFNCLDVNECSNKTRCPPNADCINIKGSFECKCKIGFTGENPYKQCSDVDECTQYRICDHGQKCTNTFGSYDCSCDQGYYLIDAEKNQCEDIDECTKFKKPCGKYNFIRCENTVGDYLCRCHHGFEFNREAKECKDIDECDKAEWPCAEEATCNNNEGSFSCACPKGYYGDGEYFCDVNGSPSMKAAKGWTVLVAMVTVLLYYCIMSSPRRV